MGKNGQELRKFGDGRGTWQSTTRDSNEHEKDTNTWRWETRESVMNRKRRKEEREENDGDMAVLASCRKNK